MESMGTDTAYIKCYVFVSNCYKDEDFLHAQGALRP